MLYRRMSVQSSYGMPDELPSHKWHMASWNAQVGRKKKEGEERIHKTARELYNDPSVPLTKGLVFAQGGAVLNNGLLDATCRARIKANDEAAAVTAIIEGRRRCTKRKRIDKNNALAHLHH